MRPLQVPPVPSSVSSHPKYQQILMAPAVCPPGIRCARAPGSALQGPCIWPQLWIQPRLIRQHLDWEKLESQAPFPLKGAGGRKLGPRGDWRKRLGRGAWNKRPAFQLRTGCGELTGAQVVKRKRNIITPGRDREKPGLRAESNQPAWESFPGLSEDPPLTGPRELPSPQPLTWTPPSVSAPGCLPSSPAFFLETGLKAPTQFLLQRAPA